MAFQVCEALLDTPLKVVNLLGSIRKNDKNYAALSKNEAVG